MVQLGLGRFSQIDRGNWMMNRSSVAYPTTCEVIILQPDAGVDLLSYLVKLHGAQKHHGK
jgi:hypothetical protein